ncbi:hypothetical protein ACFE04_008772 [Oxalis oulophora]
MEAHHLSSLNTTLKLLGGILSFSSELYQGLLLECREEHKLYVVFGMSCTFSMFPFQHFGCRFNLYRASVESTWPSANIWREKDRERAQARGKGAKGKDDGLTPEQRRERDAKALQEKTAKKAAQAAGGSESAGGKGGSKK